VQNTIVEADGSISYRLFLTVNPYRNRILYLNPVKIVMEAKSKDDRS